MEGGYVGGRALCIHREESRPLADVKRACSIRGKQQQRGSHKPDSEGNKRIESKGGEGPADAGKHASLKFIYLVQDVFSIHVHHT